MPERKVFKFYKSYYDVYKELSDKDKLLFIDALFNRQFFGIEPNDLKGLAKFAYISQKHNIDAQVAGYESKVAPIEPPIIAPIEPPIIQLEEEKKEEKKKEIELIYKMYPSICPYRNANTGKSSKDKIKIDNILKTKSFDELSKIIKLYLEDCSKSKTYLKHFSTFLNNLPDIEDNKPVKKKLIRAKRIGLPDRDFTPEMWEDYYSKEKEIVISFEEIEKEVYDD